ncbi:hypothetical protein PR001_g22562 [Phytophthora rubi]|uniref:Tyr recombinase domain-containing protein n=1 Tax=Phytophthora rubi TaxID=129364 RepID=A0A6A3IWX9_9STRA|nr:hypothetical protein PR001_g22562 [Phytophthora rubi]
MYSPWLPQDASVTSTAQLGAFAVFLWKFGMNRKRIGNSYGTICSKLCAVRWRHRFERGYDPGVTTQHALLFRGIHRFTSPVLKQQPLSPSLLRRIYSQLDIRRPSNQLQWGGLLLAYFFLLRRSEYLFIGRKYHPFVLRLGDIRFCDSDGQAVKSRRSTIVGILLRGAKNNQFGREEFRFKHASPDALLCPVRAARWVKIAARRMGTRHDEPALKMGKSGGVSSSQVARIIKATASKEGLDPARFSTHSVRIGDATKLLNAGADRLVIKLLGRWMSYCFEDYPVLTSEGTAGLSSLMCQ